MGASPVWEYGRLARLGSTGVSPVWEYGHLAR